MSNFLKANNTRSGEARAAPAYSSGARSNAVKILRSDMRCPTIYHSPITASAATGARQSAACVTSLKNPPKIVWLILNMFIKFP